MLAFYYVLVGIDKAKVNLAVIASMFSMAAFFTAFVFRFIFNERLKLKHYIGMVMLTVSITIITQSNNNNSQTI